MSYVFSYLYNLITFLKETTFLMDINNNYPIFALIGNEYFTPITLDLMVYSKNMSFYTVVSLTTEKYMDYFLFDATTPAYYFYDAEFEGHNTFLTVQRFNHSTVFEFV